MDSTHQQHVAESPSTLQEPLPPVPNSNRDNQLALDLRQLSINTPSPNAPAVSPPGTSPPAVASPQRNANLTAANSHPPSQGGSSTRPPHSPLRRSTSSTSMNGRSTPTLHKKTSMSSMQNVGGITPSRQSSSRRSSMQLPNGQGGVVKSPLSGFEDLPPPPPPATAATVASAHFKLELEAFHSAQLSSGLPADTVVVLHDACYGHRYSRPRTSKAGLSTIVERPERVHASIVGLSVAYVRLGERYTGGQNALHPKKNAANLASIPFRILKTTRKMPLSSPAVTNVHGVKWMEELKIMCDSAESKLAMNGKELTRPDMVRSPDLGKPSAFHEGDLYLCAESLNAMEGALGAVCDGVDAVFNGAASGQGPHRAFVTIRPPGHHCSASFPSGFCWVNNVHVGIQHAALNHGLTHAAMIDFDLHHGDGSQAITWDHNMRGTTLTKNAAPWKKTSIGYFSLHDINSYPCEAGDPDKVKNASLCIENAHGQNIWNVHLQEWKTEKEFWTLYETKYSVLLEKTRNFLRAQTQRLKLITNGPKPKACIFFSAGFDASEWESSGMQRHKVNVPTEFYARISRDVVRIAAEEDCSVDGRIISVLEGGYSDRALTSGVFSHISGLAGSDPAPIKKEDAQNGLGYSMAQSQHTTNQDVSAEAPHEYDPAWWAVHNLESLEAELHPPAPPAEPKKFRDPIPPTYSSPTQSFTAKVVRTPSLRRSSSNLTNGLAKIQSRPPSPPPPEVNWTTAAHELSKLLIPTDRQTFSCKPEDLTAEATRARRDRQSILAPPTESAGGTVAAAGLPVRKSLRERKAKPSNAVEEDQESEKISRANRRKTVAGGAVIAAEKAVSPTTTPKPEPSYASSTKSSRRLSVASIPGSTISTSSAAHVPSSNASSAYVRPGSSQSVRPGSSLSSRGNPTQHAPAEKKSRPATATTKGSRAPKKTPSSEISNPLGSTKPQVNRTASSSSAAGPSASADLDTLTSGMKKISITLTTKAQRDARAAKEQEEASGNVTTKPAASRSTARGSPKKPAAARKAAAPKTTTSSNKGEAGAIISEPSQVPPEVPETPVAASAPQPLGADTLPSTPAASALHTSYFSGESPAPLSTDSLNTPQHRIQSEAESLPQAPSPPSTAASSSGSNVFIPYQPEGPTPSIDVTQGPGLTWLEPNTSTPMKYKTPIDTDTAPNTEPGHTAHHHQLPVFSSTGNIPFGVRADIVKKEGDSIWDVPETPGK